VGGFGWWLGAGRVAVPVVGQTMAVWAGAGSERIVGYCFVKENKKMEKS
jgi:hypothetical protein